MQLVADDETAAWVADLGAHRFRVEASVDAGVVQTLYTTRHQPGYPDAASAYVAFTQPGTHGYAAVAYLVQSHRTVCLGTGAAGSGGVTGAGRFVTWTADGGGKGPQLVVAEFR